MTDINTYDGAPVSTNEPALEVPTFTAEQLAELQREAERAMDLQRKAALRRAKLDRVTIVAGQIAGGLVSILEHVEYTDVEHLQDDIARNSVQLAVKILEEIEALP